MRVGHDEPELGDELQCKLALIAESFQRLTGRPLLEITLPEGLWNARRVIVAHGTEADQDMTESPIDWSCQAIWPILTNRN
jgi:hypothetical protein